MGEEIAETAEETWKAETTAFERVRSVVATTYDGATASEIAERALVSETTARSHLESLAGDGFVATEARDGATVYSRSSESLILEQAHDLLEHGDRETLLRKVAEMRDEIERYRDATGADEPEDVSWSDADIDRETILEWKTTRRNLSFAKVALAVSQAEDVVTEPNAV